MCNLVFGLVFTACLAVMAGNAIAQVGPGGLINPNKDCKTVLTCQYAKGGSYRGCVSSYSCRVCRFVTASCRIGGSRGKCRRLRCTWGG
jgi:hypothetical protein